MTRRWAGYRTFTPCRSSAQTQKDGHQRNGSWACFRIAFCHSLVYNPLRSMYGMYGVQLGLVFFFLLSGWAVHKNRCAGRVDFVILSTSLQIGQYIMSSKRDREVCALCFSRWPPITAVHSFNLPRSDFLTSYHTRGQSVSVRWLNIGRKGPGEVSHTLFFFASWPRPSSRSSRVH